MPINAGADRDGLDPDAVELDAEAEEERAVDEGMASPEEDPESWGELESQKLHESGRPMDTGKDHDLGADGADISGPVPGDD